MYIPEYLFYQPKRIKKQYTTQFTGNLGFSRAQARNPKCWRKETVATQNRKKTIVLSDFKLEIQNNFTIEPLIANLKNLIKEGFSIYHWQGEGPILLDGINVECLRSEWFRKQWAPTHPQDIVKAMAAKGVVKEAVAIVDMDDLHHIEAEMQRGQTIERSKLTNLQGVLHSRHQLKDIEKSMTSPPRWTTDDGGDTSVLDFAKNNNYTLHPSDFAFLFLAQPQPLEELGLRHAKGMHVMGPGPNNLVEILGVAPQVETLILTQLDPINFSPTQGQEFTSIQKIVFNIVQLDPKEKTQFVINALQSMPNLAEISFQDLDLSVLRDVKRELEQHKGTGKYSDAVYQRFEQVKYNFPGTQVDQHNLPGLNRDLSELGKNAAGNIYFYKISFAEDVSLNSAEGLSEFMNYEFKVQKLDIEKGGIPEGFQANYARKGSNEIAVPNEHSLLALAQLEQATSLQLKEVDGPEKFKDVAIASITELDLSFKEGTRYNQIPLEILAQFAPNLYTLKLKTDNLVFSIATAKPISFDLNVRLQNLTEIELGSHTMANWAILKCLNTIAPNLQSVKMNANQEFNGNNNMLIDSLPALKNLHFTSDGELDLRYILSKQAKLTDLYLQGEMKFNTLNPDTLPAEYPFEQLTLRNYNSNVPTSSPQIIPSSYHEILKRSPHLTSLTLSGFDGVDELLDALQGFQLDKLKKIEIDNCDITFESYQALRKIAPNLASLTISNCDVPELANTEEHEFKLTVNGTRSAISAQSESSENVEQSSTDTTTNESRKPNRPSKNLFPKKQTGTAKQFHKRETDKRTDDLKVEYNVPKVFYDIYDLVDPQPSTYRIDVLNTLNITEDPNTPYKQSNKGDPEYEPYTQYTFGAEALARELEDAKKNSKKGFLGKHNITLTAEFQAIPSLKSYEELKALKIEGLSADDIEIRYSKRDNLYSIRKKTPGVISTSMEYLVDVSNKPTSKPDPRLKDLVSSFERFGGPALLDRSKLPENPTAEQELEAMYEQGLGRCELRAVQFKHFAQKHFGINDVRMVHNDCHAFVEIKEEGHWMSYDLGGHPSNVKVFEPLVMQKPILRPEQPPTTSQKRESDQRLREEAANDPHFHQHQTWEVKIDESKPEQIAQKALAQVMIDAKEGSRIGQNVLLQCQNDESADELMLTLQQTAKHTSRPYYVIDSPDQIVCATSWLKRNLKDNSGKEIAGPGGPLHDYLSQDFKGQSPVLIVNWNNFSADELVRFNTLIDAQRHADGTSIPREMVVVGVYNSAKPDAYTGSDFFSRNPVKTKVVSTLGELKDANQQHSHIDMPAQEPKQGVIEIELYNSANWREILLGQWNMDAGKLVFEEGQLARALKSGQVVHLKNAPNHLSEFNQFWRQARIDGEITTVGEKIKIPNDFWQSITQSKGYRWQNYANNVEFVGDLKSDKPPFALNAEAVNYWSDHTIIKDHLAARQFGLFEQHQGQTVKMLITGSLDEAQWAKLLNAAKQYHVKLQLGVSKDILVPKSLDEAFSIVRADKPTQTKYSIIESTDVDYSVNEVVQQLKQDKNTIVVDVSDFDEAEILHSVTPDFSGKDLRFTKKYSDIWNILKQGGNVVLKGHFSPGLKNYIATMMVEEGLYIHGQHEAILANLVVVADEPFSAALASAKHSPSIRECCKLALDSLKLNNNAELIEKVMRHEWPAGITFNQIKASIQHYVSSTPPSFDFNKALLSETAKYDQHIGPLNLSTSHVNSVCDAFEAGRMNSLMKILSTAPFAFIGGPTGVGKSTFMSKHIKPENGFHLYNENNELKKWALDRTAGKVKVLFIDEANISDKNYMQFDGLYQVPPFILIDGEIIELTADHKVVFAGNPMSYGGERNLPKLIAEHGNSCTFGFMPPEYIYREVLSPIFTAAEVPASIAQDVSQIILRTYQDLCVLSKDEVLISPRELKMMAMAIISSPEIPPEKIIFRVAEQCLPPALKPTFEAMFRTGNPQYNNQDVQNINQSAERPNQFVLTPSRYRAYESLIGLLRVRQLAAETEQKVLQTPGLGGMLIEGEPGGGKSHFMMDVLLEQGYERIQPPPPNQPIPPLTHAKQFYYLPASLAFDEKRRILLTAFEQGALVVTDEINSGPMMEQLLNALLMGQHPDTKQPPTKAGFMLLATQNPISMAGRQETSRAIKRRLLFEEFQPLPGEEMRTILKGKFNSVPTELIAQHVWSHQLAAAFAKANHREPVPVFRDLYKIVEKEHLDRTRKLETMEQKQEAVAILQNDENKNNRSSNIALTRKKPITASFKKQKAEQPPLVTVGGDYSVDPSTRKKH